jgi:hypothetical protein
MSEITIVDCESGAVEARPMTAEELAQREVDAAAAAAALAEREAKAAQRAALLERLGLSEDEAVLLLGGGS